MWVCLSLNTLWIERLVARAKAYLCYEIFPTHTSMHYLWLAPALPGSVTSFPFFCRNKGNWKLLTRLHKTVIYTKSLYLTFWFVYRLCLFNGWRLPSAVQPAQFQDEKDILGEGGAGEGLKLIALVICWKFSVTLGPNSHPHSILCRERCEFLKFCDYFVDI